MFLFIFFVICLIVISAVAEYQLVQYITYFHKNNMINDAILCAIAAAALLFVFVVNVYVLVKLV